MNKKIIIGFILILILGIAGYFYFTRNKSEQENQNTATLSIKKVLDETVISPVGAYNNDSIWYFNSDSKLFKANIDGSNLSEYPLPTLPGTVSQILWPKTGSDFIAILRNGSKISKGYYESSTKLFIELAENIQWVDWLPDGKRIVYVCQSSDKKSQQLVMSNADGSGYKSIASLFWPDLVLKASPDGNTVLMYRSQAAGDVNKLYSVNLDTGVISTMIDTGKTTGVMWLPIGNKFLYSQNSKLYLYDVLNRLPIDLNLNTTIDKIVSDPSGKVAYAAVSNKDKAGDYFVKVNLTNNLQEIYFTPPGTVTVKSIMLVGNTVYYVDSKDNKLYMISK